MNGAQLFLSNKKYYPAFGSQIMQFSHKIRACASLARRLKVTYDHGG